jgi:hypothetical protein
MNTHIHFILMITSKKLNRFDLEINEIDRQERFAVDGDVVSN